MPKESQLIPYRRESILSQRSSLVSKSGWSRAPYQAVRRKPDVHWRYKTQRQVPVKTTVVNVDRRVQLLNADKAAQDARQFVQHKKQGSLGFLPSPSTPKPADRPDDIFSQLNQLSRVPSDGNRMLKTNLRMIKARLNAIYRAKIPSLGISFKFVLTPEEKMQLRRRNFRIHTQPIIRVQSTKSSELKEEFNSYCGQRQKVRNWLFQV